MKRNRKNSLLTIGIGLSLLTMAVANTGCGGGGGSNAALTLIYALTDQGRVMMLSPTSPGTATQAFVVKNGSTTLNVDGLDFDSATDTLYAVRQNGSVMEWYSVNTTTGQATLVTTGGVGAPGSPFGVSYDPSGGRCSLMQNPPSLNIKVGSVAGTLVPSTSVVVGIMNLSEVAHTGQEPQSATTTCYAVDSMGGSLYTIGAVNSVEPAFNSGTATLVGNFGLSGAIDARAGFDIGGTAATGYLGLNVAGTAGLYTIDLTTGAATLVAHIGGLSAGEKVVGLCVVE